MSIGSFGPANLKTFVNTNPPCTKKKIGKRERDTLIIGDGNFSFTKTWVCRRQTGMGLKSQTPDPSFGSRVISTEYKSERDCLRLEGVATTIRSLTKKGVRFYFGVDATEIHRVFIGKKFGRIQWNCPDIGEGFCSASNRLARTIHSFALSAAQLQDEGGTIHLTLIAPERQPDYRIWQGFHYEIVEAMEGTGYVLESVKNSTRRYVFNETTFYRHQKTTGDRKIEAAGQGLNEFIFRRTFDPNARTPSEWIDSVRGYQTNYRTGERDYGNKEYYSMPLRPGLSSDSDCEPPENLSIEENVFEDSPTETNNNQNGCTWAQITASKKSF